MGTIHLYASLEIVKEKLLSKFNFVSYKFLKLLPSVFSFFLFFQFFVAKHLKIRPRMPKPDFEDLSGPDLELKRRLPESTDELQDLTDSFNDMKRKLKKLINNLELCRRLN